MKSILLSIKPKYVELIATRKKTIEVRRTVPQEVPFKAYIYQTKSKDNSIYKRYKVNDIKSGKVIGEFICDKVIRTCGWRLRGDTQQCAKRTVAETEFPKLACLTIDEIVDYAGSENREVVGWHISDLKIYDKPKELSEFKTGCKGCKERDTYHCAFYCYGERPLTRPPQSYMFVEEVER